MTQTQRIFVEHVRRAIRGDCRGIAWWRVLVEDILCELVSTREVLNASMLPTRAELDSAGIADLRDQARRWRAFLEMMRHTFDSVGPENDEGWRCAGRIVAGMVDAALKGEEP